MQSSLPSPHVIHILQPALSYSSYSSTSISNYAITVVYRHHPEMLLSWGRHSGSPYPAVLISSLGADCLAKILTNRRISQALKSLLDFPSAASPLALSHPLPPTQIHHAFQMTCDRKSEKTHIVLVENLVLFYKQTQGVPANLCYCNEGSKEIILLFGHAPQNVAGL